MIGAENEHQLRLTHSRFRPAPDLGVDRAAAKVVDVRRDNAPAAPGRPTVQLIPLAVFAKRFFQLGRVLRVAQTGQRWLPVRLAPVILKPVALGVARSLIVQEQGLVQSGKGIVDRRQIDRQSELAFKLGFDFAGRMPAIAKDQHLGQRRR